MALPVAALITSFLSHYRTPKEVMYKSIYDSDDDTEDGVSEDSEEAAAATGDAASDAPPAGNDASS